MTALPVEFTVPGRPRGKERARIAPGQTRPYTPPETVRAEKEIYALWLQATDSRQPALGPVKLTVLAVFEIPASWPAPLRDAAARGLVYHIGKPDRDNIEKLVMDALNGHAWADDGQVAVGQIIKRYGTPQRTTVVIESLDSPAVPATPGQSRREERVARGEPATAPRPRRANPIKSKIAKLPKALQAAVDRALAKERPR